MPSLKAASAVSLLLAAVANSAPTYNGELSNPTATLSRGTTPNATVTHIPGAVYTPYPQDTTGFYNISQPASIKQQADPSYEVLSRFDYQSINLALNQEWIELDLFHHALAIFSVEDFEAVGMTAADRFLLEFMADQEVGHATVLSNMLGPKAAKQCTYQYPFQTVSEFLDFTQKLTRWGESGVYGFLTALENGNSAQILLQSITTEARQQMIFRQFEGLFAMPIYFLPGVPQSWAWTLLSPYLKSCPETNPYIEWDIYPTLLVNSPNATDDFHPSAISTNRTSLSSAGRVVEFTFEAPGVITGPDGAYKTISHSKTMVPKFAAWTSHYNVTYSELYDVTATTAKTNQPSGLIFPGEPQVTNDVINGTLFIALVDTDLHVTPSNTTMLNPHIIAGPAMYVAD